MTEWFGHRGRPVGNRLAPSFSPLSDAVGNVGEFGEYPDGHDLVYWFVGCVGAQAGELEFRQGDAVEVYRYDYKRKKMRRTRILIVIVTVVSIGLIAIAGVIFWRRYTALSGTPDESAIHSPYAGQESRGIKALSQQDVEGLLAGTGTPFGGMAKAAELNGYPGPRHVLDAVKAGEFELTGGQQEQIEALYEEMRAEAIELGEKIINVEKAIDDAFLNGTITEELLQEKVVESAALYGQLRISHLKYHLSMVDILTPQQVTQYNELRGYTSGDPCENIPEGHDPEMWKLHNNCE